MDITGDDAGVWMTYDQLAVARDIQRDAARRLAQRHRWRRQTGNDGLARVFVPHEWASIPRDIPQDVARDRERSLPKQPEPAAPDVAGVVATLQGAIDTLRRQLIRADGRADAFQIERDQALADLRLEREQRTADATRMQAALDEAVAGLKTEHNRADMLRDRLDAAEGEMRQAREVTAQAQQHAREAEDAVATMRLADENRKARGRWSRLRAAWRGE